MSSIASFFADRRGQAVEPDRAATELVDDGLEQPAVGLSNSCWSTSSNSSASADRRRHTAVGVDRAKSRTRLSRRFAMRGVPRDGAQAPEPRPERFRR